MTRVVGPNIIIRVMSHTEVLLTEYWSPACIPIVLMTQEAHTTVVKELAAEKAQRYDAYVLSVI